jgi:hypothetical protein
LGFVFGVPEALEEFDEGKLAGWKRGNEGSLRLDEPELSCLLARRRDAWDGMASVSEPVLAERVVGGDMMRGDMVVLVVWRFTGCRFRTVAVMTPDLGKAWVVVVMSVGGGGTGVERYKKVEGEDGGSGLVEQGDVRRPGAGGG